MLGARGNHAPSAVYIVKANNGNYVQLLDGYNNLTPIHPNSRSTSPLGSR